MNKLKNSLVALTGLMIIFSVFAFIFPARMKAQGGGNVQPLNVNVINPLSAPVPVRDVDNATHVYQEGVNLSISPGAGGTSASMGDVPGGKRLVIESVTVAARVPLGDTPVIELVVRAGAPHEHEHYISVSYQGQTNDGRLLYVGTHALRAYIDEFNNVRVRFSHSNTDSSASGDVTLSGYYVDLQ